MPHTIPCVKQLLSSWSKMSFRELCVEIILLFSGDEIPRDDLQPMIDIAYNRFSSADVTPVVHVGDMTICELFHGPTLAFKDIALQMIGQMLQYFLSKRQSWLTVLVGTSGDTGRYYYYIIFFCMFFKHIG